MQVVDLVRRKAKQQFFDMKNETDPQKLDAGDLQILCAYAFNPFLHYHTYTNSFQERGIYIAGELHNIARFHKYRSVKKRYEEDSVQGEKSTIILYMHQFKPFSDCVFIYTYLDELGTSVESILQHLLLLHSAPLHLLSVNSCYLSLNTTLYQREHVFSIPFLDSNMTPFR